MTRELPVLVLFDGWASLFGSGGALADRALGKARTQLEREVLPEYVAGRRWFAAKSEEVARVALVTTPSGSSTGGRTWLFALARVEGASGDAQTYFLPLSLVWDDGSEEQSRALAPFTIAKIRQQAEVGVMADAFGDERFCQALVAAIGEGAEIRMAQGRVRFSAPAPLLASRAFPPTCRRASHRSEQTRS